MDIKHAMRAEYHNPCSFEIDIHKHLDINNIHKDAFIQRQRQNALLYVRYKKRERY